MYGKVLKYKDSKSKRGYIKMLVVFGLSDIKHGYSNPLKLGYPRLSL